MMTTQNSPPSIFPITVIVTEYTVDPAIGSTLIVHIATPIIHIAYGKNRNQYNNDTIYKYQVSMKSRIRDKKCLLKRSILPFRIRNTFITYYQ